MKNHFDIISVGNIEYINFNDLINFINDIKEKKEKEEEELKAKKDTMDEPPYLVRLNNLLCEVMTLNKILYCLYKNNTNFDF